MNIQILEERAIKRKHYMKKYNEKYRIKNNDNS